VILPVLTCVYCQDTDGPFNDDHVVPRSRGGPDGPMNLVNACARCNKSKSDLLPSEWLTDVPPLVAAIEARVSLSIGNRIRSRRDGAKRKRPTTAMVPSFCYFCGGRLSAADGFLEIFDQEAGPPYHGEHIRFLAGGGRQERGQLSWPGTGKECTHWHGFSTVGLLTHKDCGPENEGYWFSLASISDPGDAHGIARHIATKRWFTPSVNDDFWLAVKVAQALSNTPTFRRAERK
jgi:hypothetical protein